MKNVCVIFGGKSVESEVSIITAKQAMQNFDYSRYKMYPVFIDKKGLWWTGKNFDDVATFRDFNPKKHTAVTFGQKIGGLSFGRKFVKIDCALICCHGNGGEDGSLQGLFNMLDIAYTSSGVEASSLCMNKISMKKYFEYLDLPIAKYTALNKYKDYDLEQILKKLQYPIFVKPANLGSSVGINKCNSLDEVREALKVAFCFDDDVILEQGIQNLIEYNCATMKIGEKICSSQIEQSHAWSDFLNFEDKYIKKGKKFGKKITKTNIGIRLEKKIKTMAELVHDKFGLDGVVRTDFLYDKIAKKLYINEINTIPGSLSFYLWKNQKMSFKDILENLIEDSITRHQKRQLLCTEFDSKILDKHLK